MNYMFVVLKLYIFLEFFYSTLVYISQIKLNYTINQPHYEEPCFAFLSCAFVRVVVRLPIEAGGGVLAATGSSVNAAKWHANVFTLSD